MDDAAQVVASHVVGAQEIPDRRTLQPVHQVHFVRLVGSEDTGEDADYDQQQDDDCTERTEWLLLQ